MNATAPLPPATEQQAGRAIAEVIGEYAANFRYEDIPDSVREQARYLLLDAVGIAFASANFEFAQRAYTALAGGDGEGDSEGDCTVIGLPATMALRDAVLMNSVMVHGLDFDDTYLPGLLHPSASTFPCAFGVAESVDASGRDLLAAYVLGTEVMTRLATVAKGMFNPGGLHPSSLLGGFTSAIMTGWLTGMNAQQLTMAQGIAVGMAAGTLESLQDGSWTKRIQPGWAAASGITAARLARQGFVGSKACYEGRFGLFPAMLGARAADCDYAAATHGLGTTWNSLRMALKPFPACHAAQAVIQAAIAIARKTAVTAEEIDSVTAIVPGWYVKLVCEPLDRKRRPDSVYGAQFSLPYTAAASLLNGRFGLAEIQDAALRDARTLALAEKVGYEVGAHFTAPPSSNSAPADLVVRTKDGRTLKESVTHLIGTPDRPMTHAEISAKFMENATFVMSKARAMEIHERVLMVDSLSSARDFAALMRH